MILDLSFPPGHSVNDAIDKDYYCGLPIKLTYPSTDDIVKRIIELKGKCLLFKHDLSRFFRQVPLCPLDWSLAGMRWKDLLFFDKFFPMGLRSAAYCCQEVTNLVTFVHTCLQYWSINYLDDFGGAETPEVAWESFQCLGKILMIMGIDKAIGKSVHLPLEWSSSGMYLM